ncbi:MAG: type IVB secretion system protein IcmH/DotU [Alphaproteobacteria bacterium]
MADKDPFGLDGGDEENDKAKATDAGAQVPPVEETASEPDLDGTVIEPRRPAVAAPIAPKAPPSPAPETRPVPERRRAAEPAAKDEAPFEPAPPQGDTARLDLSGPDSLTFGRVTVDLRHGNLLVAAGARALRLAALMSESPGEIPDLAAAKFAAEQSLFAFDEQAKQFTIKEEEAEPARFILAALIDDLAMSGRWADKSAWRDNLLVGPGVTREQTSVRFFDLVEAKEVPGANARLRELLYIALAIGFSGSLRTDPRGPMLLNQHRARLLGQIRERLDRGERPGAVAYGGGAAGRGLALVNPVTMAVAGVLLVVGSLALAIWAYGGETPGEERVAGSPAPTAKQGLTPIQDTLSQRAISALASDIDAGTVSVAETESALVFVLNVAGLFQPGESTLSASSAGTIRRVGAALSYGEGPVDVVVMAGGDVAFGPEADEARQMAAIRASEVQRHLASWVSDSSRLTSWGVGPMPQTIDARSQNTDFPDRLAIVLRKNVRPSSLAAQRYLQPAWF